MIIEGRNRPCIFFIVAQWPLIVLNYFKVAGVDGSSTAVTLMKVKFFGLTENAIFQLV